MREPHGDPSSFDLGVSDPEPKPPSDNTWHPDEPVAPLPFGVDERTGEPKEPTRQPRMSEDEMAGVLSFISLLALLGVAILLVALLIIKLYIWAL